MHIILRIVYRIILRKLGDVCTMDELKAAVPTWVCCACGARRKGREGNRHARMSASSCWCAPNASNRRRKNEKGNQPDRLATLLLLLGGRSASRWLARQIMIDGSNPTHPVRVTTADRKPESKGLLLLLALAGPPVITYTRIAYARAGSARMNERSQVQVTRDRRREPPV